MAGLGRPVRALRREDRPALAALVAAVENFNAAERECAMELVDIYLGDEAQRDYRFAVVDGAAGDGAATVAAYACWGPVPLTRGTFDLYWIAAHPAARRRGLGRLLMEHVQGRARLEGGRILVAETSAKESYRGTIAFYQRLGFQEVSHIRDFYDVGDDRLIFIRRLT
ncbi:MAG: GNAT family N-acetyltransferase [Acidobacteriota bacterium]|nr:GNAT family N-acetyltransferase [Acidobacteriota bacterium]